MAKTKITPVNAKIDKFATEFSALATACDATNGNYFETTEATRKYLIVCSNSSDSTNYKVTISKGNNVFAVGADLEVTITKGKSTCIVVDGAYVDADGNVNIKGANAAILIGVYAL